MSKTAYRVEGDFQMGRIRQHFSVEVAVEGDEDRAREHIYNDLGSRHNVKRRQVDITSVKALKADDVQDGIVRSRLG